ncbi:MAG: hypothetical protein ACREMB_22820 [Candidatus Rokuibacteriota bacterium]
MPDDAPKTAYELAMERLRQKERESGAEERPLSGEEKAAIGEVRQVYEAKLAERQILYQHSLRQARTHEEVAKLDEEFARDRERFASDRDRKIAEIRKKPGS